MKKILLTPLALIFIALVVSRFTTTAQQTIQYPKTRKVDHVDTYHGAKVADPYRWLEDDNSARDNGSGSRRRTRVTFAYLEKIPLSREGQRAADAALQLSEILSAPFRRGEYFFLHQERRLAEPERLYMQKGLEGTPEVLLDPNKFSADGTTRLGAFSLSKDGKYLAYGISQGGSDWQEYHVMEVASRKVAARQVAVGEGIGRLMAGRWFLLQPLSRAGEGSGTDDQEREPPGLLSQSRHAAIRRRAGL